MRRCSFYCLLMLMVCLPYRALCNHIFGGELTYTHVSGLTYKITMTLYGDCGSPGSAFAQLVNAQPNIKIFTNAANPTIILLDLEPASVAEITPVCTALQNDTKCTNAASTIPGVKRFSYSKLHTLPAPAPNWQFVFDGLLGVGTAGRASTITNVTNPGPQSMYLVAELNNTTAPNSSPQFTTIPTPFFCSNTPQAYNQGAVDPENDVLAFSLAPALSNSVPVNYVFPLSATLPMSTTTGAFGFDTLTGQMNFTPDISQNALIVNKVTEYRNGVKVGSITREMTFVILDNCQNTTSTDTITQLVNSVAVPGNIVNVCEGAPNVSFITSYADADGDTMNISYSGLPAGATINVVNNNSTNPSFEFDWNTSAIPVGLYTFFVTIKEDNCPINSQQTKSYTIRIAQPNELTTTILSPTNCSGNAGILFNLTNGIIPRVVTITEGGNTIKTTTDSTGSFVDSLPAGNYTIDVVSPTLPCPITTFTLVVTDTGTYPYAPVITDPLVYCIGDPGGQINAVPDAGATVHWYDINGIQLPSPPVVNTAVTGTSYYLLNQQLGNCVSRLDTVMISVSENPEIAVVNAVGSVCIGDRIYLQATGGEQYTWLPEDKIQTDRDGRLFIRVMEPATYQVVGRNQNGCADTVSFAYTDIQPCCTFSYPNAFTPNGDSRNDTWHPVMHGNEVRYELVILNRWGNELFRSLVPNEGWDGTKAGMVQEIGTYFFYMKAKCITGKEEVYQGAFHLIK